MVDTIQESVRSVDRLPVDRDIVVDKQASDEISRDKDTTSLTAKGAIVGLEGCLVRTIEMQTIFRNTRWECMIFEQCAENLFEALLLLFIVVVVVVCSLKLLELFVDCC